MNESLAERLAALPAGMIDMHTHVVDPRLARMPRSDGLPVVEQTSDDRLEIWLNGTLYRVVDDRCWRLESRLRDMDREGVAAHVLSPMPVMLCSDQPADVATAVATLHNDLMAELVAEVPSRFLGMGMVPLQDPRAAIEELRRCIDDLSFVGIEIPTKVGPLELTDPALEPFFTYAAEREALIFVHPVDQALDARFAKLGIGFGLGMPTETAVAMARWLTSDVADRTRGLRLVLAHGGGVLPAALGRLERGQQLAGGAQGGSATERATELWADSLTYDAPSLELAARRFGPAHIVLGTDYPFDAREVPAGRVLHSLSAPLDATTVGRTNVVQLLGAQPSAAFAPRAATP